MANVSFCKGTLSPSSPTYPFTDGMLYFNTYLNKIYFNNGGTVLTYDCNDTKNTAGSSDTTSKIYLIGAPSQIESSQTFSHDTAYIASDGCLYSGGAKTIVYKSSTSPQTISATSHGEAGSTVEITQTCHLPTGYVPLGPVTAIAAVVTGQSAAVIGYGFTTTGENAGRVYATIRMQAKAVSTGTPTGDGYPASASATVTFSCSPGFAYYG